MLLLLVKHTAEPEHVLSQRDYLQRVCSLVFERTQAGGGGANVGLRGYLFIMPVIAECAGVASALQPPELLGYTEQNRPCLQEPPEEPGRSRLGINVTISGCFNFMKAGT